MAFHEKAGWSQVGSFVFSLDTIEFERGGKRLVATPGNHGSIRGSWPMAISVYPGA